MAQRSTSRPAAAADVRRRRKLRGFSYVELVAGILILAVVARVAIPRFAGALARSRLDAAARRLALDLRLAQQRARQTSTTVRVTFNTSAASYALVGCPDPDRPSQDYQRNLGAAPYEATITGASFNGAAEVAFNGFGAANCSGGVILSAGGDFKSVSVDAGTGAVNISSGKVALAVAETVNPL